MPDGSDGRWRWGKPSVLEAIKNDDLEFVKEIGGWVVYEKIYEPKIGEENTKKFTTWLDDVGATSDGTDALKALFDEPPFSFPKPPKLIERLIDISAVGMGDSHDIVLDFFAGSGSTAEAVLKLKRNNGQRHNFPRFILTQLPEPIDHSDFQNISDITKERVRRVIKKLNQEDNNESGQDRGFKVFKLQSSNFKAWNAEQPKDDVELTKQLTLHVEHLVSGRTQDDVLYELLLKSGFPLDTPIEKVTLANKTVFSIADGMMMVCLENELTLEVLKAIADKKPERVVCLDAGFANNDQLKTNAVQTMKAKGVTKFQTV